MPYNSGYNANGNPNYSDANGNPSYQNANGSQYSHGPNGDPYYYSVHTGTLNPPASAPSQVNPYFLQQTASSLKPEQKNGMADQNQPRIRCQTPYRGPGSSPGMPNTYQPIHQNGLYPSQVPQMPVQQPGATPQYRVGMGHPPFLSTMSPQQQQGMSDLNQNQPGVMPMGHLPLMSPQNQQGMSDNNNHPGAMPIDHPPAPGTMNPQYQPGMADFNQNQPGAMPMGHPPLPGIMSPQDQQGMAGLNQNQPGVMPMGHLPLMSPQYQPGMSDNNNQPGAIPMGHPPLSNTMSPQYQPGMPDLSHNQPGAMPMGYPASPSMMGPQSNGNMLSPQYQGNMPNGQHNQLVPASTGPLLPPGAMVPQYNTMLSPQYQGNMFNSQQGQHNQRMTAPTGPLLSRPQLPPSRMAPQSSSIPSPQYQENMFNGLVGQGGIASTAPPIPPSIIAPQFNGMLNPQYQQPMFNGQHNQQGAEAMRQSLPPSTIQPEFNNHNMLEFLDQEGVPGVENSEQETVVMGQPLAPSIIEPQTNDNDVLIPQSQEGTAHAESSQPEALAMDHTLPPGTIEPQMLSLGWSPNDMANVEHIQPETVTMDQLLLTMPQYDDNMPSPQDQKDMSDVQANQEDKSNVQENQQEPVPKDQGSPQPDTMPGVNNPAFWKENRFGPEVIARLNEIVLTEEPTGPDDTLQEVIPKRYQSVSEATYPSMEYSGDLDEDLDLWGAPDESLCATSTNSSTITTVCGLIFPAIAERVGPEVNSNPSSQQQEPAAHPAPPAQQPPAATIPTAANGPVKSSQNGRKRKASSPDSESGTDGEGKPRKKRRIVRADSCEACRKQKVRCMPLDGEDKCSRCHSKGIECKFSHVDNRTNRTKYGELISTIRTYHALVQDFCATMCLLRPSQKETEEGKTARKIYNNNKTPSFIIESTDKPATAWAKVPRVKELEQYRRGDIKLEAIKGAITRVEHTGLRLLGQLMYICAMAYHDQLSDEQIGRYLKCAEQGNIPNLEVPDEQRSQNEAWVVKLYDGKFVPWKGTAAALPAYPNIVEHL
ncbi:hypothetical protein F5Y05DRAFT_179104 [Hypoxylon sp. FL0543]|nr:hypothetical protein F5Y05DRAFT_179104 [Hypoxylon sp. FL0543]